MRNSRHLPPSLRPPIARPNSPTAFNPSSAPTASTATAPTSPEGDVSLADRKLDRFRRGRCRAVVEGGREADLRRDAAGRREATDAARKGRRRRLDSLRTAGRRPPAGVGAQAALSRLRQPDRSRRTVPQRGERRAGPIHAQPAVEAEPLSLRFPVAARHGLRPGAVRAGDPSISPRSSSRSRSKTSPASRTSRRS